MRYESALQLALLFFIAAYLLLVNGVSIYCVSALGAYSIYWIVISIVRAVRES